MTYFQGTDKKYGRCNSIFLITPEPPEILG